MIRIIPNRPIYMTNSTPLTDSERQVIQASLTELRRCPPPLFEDIEQEWIDSAERAGIDPTQPVSHAQHGKTPAEVPF